jgi:predicted esterase
MREHHLRVPRTARYYVAGEPTAATREIWFVCHGYGQLARLFLRHFEPLAVGDRVVVAAEALNRFYLEDPEGGHKNARVGATWMTREDRLAEIADYVGYLDAVYDDVRAAAEAASPRIVVLGFSQGVATACRWAVTGRVRADRLVLWAERLPHDLDVRAHKEKLRALALTIVVGLDDRWVSREAVAEHETLLAAEGIPVNVISFQGGHRMDADTLRALAGG